MKKLKLLLYSLALFLLMIVITRCFVRLPSYSIQTSGKLYIVNKISRNIEVFDLFTGKEVAEIPIDLESHEAVALSEQNKVVVTNYGTVDRDGNRIKIINTQTNKVEKTIDLKGSITSNGIVAFPGSNKVAVIDYVSNNLL
ncbi:MAG: DNA-binding beta-propeller fold protein YncE, partial [Saprospiraceae bacterium]